MKPKEKTFTDFVKVSISISMFTILKLSTFRESAYMPRVVIPAEDHSQAKKFSYLSNRQALRLQKKILRMTKL